MRHASFRFGGEVIGSIQNAVGDCRRFPRRLPEHRHALHPVEHLAPFGVPQPQPL
jgi:hypothetical protein